MPKKYIDLDTLKYILYDVHKLENLLVKRTVPRPRHGVFGSVYRIGKRIF